MKLNDYESVLGDDSFLVFGMNIEGANLVRDDEQGYEGLVFVKTLKNKL